MLTGNEVFVVIRLTTGEQMMCALEQEDDTYIELAHPMVIRTIQSIETGREHITAAPFCAFSAETSYVIDKKNVVFIKPLKEIFIPHYMRIVKEHETVSFNASEERISAEEARKRIAMLANIFGDQLDEELGKQEEIKPTYIEGNDTKH
jgi:hypothetical protein